MSGQSGGKRQRLAEFNSLLTCKLCGGYYIDATTISECLHSFCKSCIVKHLETSKQCPVCSIVIHKSKPLLNIKPDLILQDIVYKLVPGCYQNEMQKRKEFYAKNPEAKIHLISPEARGEPEDSYIYSPDESLSLSLEYYSPETTKETENIDNQDAAIKHLPRRYLRCPAAVTVFHLQKLIRAKYGLNETHRIDIIYKEETLCASYTLMDIMYIHHWKRKVPLHLSYRIFESERKKRKMSELNDEFKQVLSCNKMEVDAKEDDQFSKREWKEVQLKISETGVMSVTDISNLETKKSTNENVINQQIDENCVVPSVNNLNNINEDKNSKNISNEKNKNSQQEKESEKNQQEPIKIQVESKGDEKDIKSTKQQNVAKEPVKNGSELNMSKESVVTNKSELSRIKIDSSSEKLPKTSDEKLRNLQMETDDCSENKDKPSSNKLENNSKAQSHTNETKPNTQSAGAKINALSAKLQVQPKIGSTTNSDVKKSLLDKQKSDNSITILNDPKITNVSVKSESSKLAENIPESKLKNSTAVSLNSTLENDSPTRRSIKSELVNNRIENSEHKNLSHKSLTTDQQLRSLPGMPHIGKDIICSTTSSGSSGSVGRFSIQTPSMSIYSITPSKNNSFASSSQSYSSIGSKPAYSSAKGNHEIPNMYSTPPCPDAIPISQMKSNRKNNIAPSGSKINDICAKIGESTKEKNKLEASGTQRVKPDVPDLLKISKSTPETIVPTKHIPNIPNISMFNAGTNNQVMALIENKDKRQSSSLSPVQAAFFAQAAQSVRNSPQKKQSQAVGYKTLRDPPKSWNPTLSKNNYVAVKNQAKELMNQAQINYGLTDGMDTSKQGSSKPAKIFKIRNTPRFLGNPASGVKPMYGVSNDQPSPKDKDQALNQKFSQHQIPKGSVSMMKIDQQTMPPLLPNSNSPIGPPSPYTPKSTRNYPTSPFSIRPNLSTSSSASAPLSKGNSPINMLSTNPFIPSLTPNTNPGLMYSHFPTTYKNPINRFTNPLIRPNMNIPPQSAFHTNLPPSISKMYERSNFLNQSATSRVAGALAYNQARLAAAMASSASVHASSSPPISAAPTLSKSSKPTSNSPNTNQSVPDSVGLLGGALQIPKNLPQRDVNAYDLSRLDNTSSKQQMSSNKSKLEQQLQKSEEPKHENTSETNNQQAEKKTDGKTQVKLNGGIEVSTSNDETSKSSAHESEKSNDEVKTSVSGVKSQSSTSTEKEAKDSTNTATEIKQKSGNVANVESEKPNTKIINDPQKTKTES
ncbi:hypothetical protein TKK_0019487 [Trichogramma kaykai]|uniref:RING-type domain-containing protein n=1 Tax=Trichogramma kaykai TaxID=54128 RepID=A0ABD2VT07_9HYME